MPPDESACYCSVCGSDELEGIEGEYKTGVVAPDGGCEWRWWRGYRCRNCGNEEEE